MKKIAIIGRGSAGALSMLTAIDSIRDFKNFNLKYQFDWYFDSSVETQAVGEGTTLTVPTMLRNAVNFSYSDLYKIDGTFKDGISKRNWTKNHYVHHFFPPEVAYHINALKLQDYIFEISKRYDCIRLHDKHVTAKEIDADLVIDCSGRPNDYSDYHLSSYIPVNSVYVTQCYWDHPKFQRSITDATPDGWCFGIPLQNRCSIGYIYNNNFTTIEKVKENVKEIFGHYNLTPSDNTNAFSFKNYYRKVNYVDNVMYNGNASFFLEPLEATTLANVVVTARDAIIGIIDPEIKNKNNWRKFLNDRYQHRMESVTTMIMLHYYAGSIFENDFWRYAKSNGERCIVDNYHKHEQFRLILDYVIKAEKQIPVENRDLFSPFVLKYNNALLKYNKYFSSRDIEPYGTWQIENWLMNIHGLGLLPNLKKLLNITY